MDFVTVFRHVPAPIIGMVGTFYDRGFEMFEADLDWLETTGVQASIGCPWHGWRFSRRAMSGSS